MHFEADPNSAPSPHQADRLWSRTYLSLLVAQFFAAFNDQAIHASAMFFAINTGTLTESEAISLMPILFYAPWGIFVTLSGYFADRYSKRYSLVFWKFAEVGICALALLGFYLGTQPGTAHLGSWIVLSTVFLMGTHSAFFVPAKYGVMPEILQPHLLSRGNGILESLSFLAVILGTMSGGVLSFLFYGQETIIGFILLGLAAFGALVSLFIRKMPAANPTLKFPSYIYGPLRKNLRIMFSSRPLVFAVIGIAFFTFVVAFMRATVYMLGESQDPRWNELKTSAVVGTVAFGIGLGSPLAGWLSGRKIELGLIPVGALGMVIATCVAGLVLQSLVPLVACIVVIGFATGFYLVPLFTLLQYRAPKANKGDMIATSNFIDISGAIGASVLFFLIVLGAKKVGYLPPIIPEDGYANGQLVVVELEVGRPVYFEVQPDRGAPRISGGEKPEPGKKTTRDLWDEIFGPAQETGHSTVIELERGVRQDDRVVVSRYRVGSVEHFSIRDEGKPLKPKYDQRQLPTLLFLGGGAMNLGMLLVLCYLLPDLPQRGLWLLKNFLGRKAYVTGLNNLPGVGGVLLVTDALREGDLRHIVSAVDRRIRFYKPSETRLSEITGWLKRGNVALIQMASNTPSVVEGIRGETMSVAVVPVHCEREKSRMVVGFARHLDGPVTEEALLAAFEVARE
jgi:MFS family permease